LGWTAEQVTARTLQISQTLKTIFENANKQGVPNERAACDSLPMSPLIQSLQGPVEGLREIIDVDYAAGLSYSNQPLSTSIRD